MVIKKRKKENILGKRRMKKKKMTKIRNMHK